MFFFKSLKKSPRAPLPPFLFLFRPSPPPPPARLWGGGGPPAGFPPHSHGENQPRPFSPPPAQNRARFPRFFRVFFPPPPLSFPQEVLKKKFRIHPKFFGFFSKTQHFLAIFLCLFFISSIRAQKNFPDLPSRFPPGPPGFPNAGGGFPPAARRNAAPPRRGGPHSRRGAWEGVPPAPHRGWGPEPIARPRRAPGSLFFEYQPGPVFPHTGWSPPLLGPKTPGGARTGPPCPPQTPTPGPTPLTVTPCFLFFFFFDFLID